MSDQQKSLRFGGLSLIVLGALFAATVLPGLAPVHRTLLIVAYWPVHPVPVDLAVPVPLLVAISGGLTAGLGGMMWALGTHVSPVSPEAAAKVTKTAAWCWFVTDSLMSVAAGAPFNAVLNLSFLALMLWACRIGEPSGQETAA